MDLSKICSRNSRIYILGYMQEIAARDAEDARLGGEEFRVIKRTVMSYAAPISVHTQIELPTYGTGCKLRDGK